MQRVFSTEQRKHPYSARYGGILRIRNPAPTLLWGMEAMDRSRNTSIDQAKKTKSIHYAALFHNWNSESNLCTDLILMLTSVKPTNQKNLNFKKKKKKDTSKLYWLLNNGFYCPWEQKMPLTMDLNSLQAPCYLTCKIQNELKKSAA